MIETNEKTFSFAEFELDTALRRLLKNGQTVMLNPKAFDVLTMLVKNRGQICSKEELLETVWEGSFVEENNLSVQISVLRKIFAEKKGEHQFIVTIPGKGYKFIGELNFPQPTEIVIENHSFSQITVDEEIEAEPSAAKLISKGNPPKRQAIFALIGLILVISAGFAASRYFFATPKVQINSLAVLPFVNQNNDPNTEYLSDGLAESVIYALSQFPNLKVMSRNSVFRYKGKDAEAKSIGADLNVQAILTGRVVQRGDNLTVSAELIDTSNNAVLWGEQFTRKMSNAEELQADITRAISEKLRLKLSGGDELKTKKHSTENAEAYRHYLQGLFYWNKRNPENIKKSIEQFNQAIELDPLYTQAYGALAMAYNTLDSNAVMNKAEIAENKLKVKALTLKALELDDEISEAHAVLAGLKIDEWDFVGGENQYKRAIELNPNFATAHQWYSELLARLGRHDEAFTEIRRAYELDPFSRAINANIGLRYGQARRFDEALTQFKKVAGTEPDYPIVYMFAAGTYQAKGLYDEAIESQMKAELLFQPELSEDIKQKIEVLRSALKTNGAKGYWQKQLEYGLVDFKAGYASAFSVAAIYARLGEKDKTFEWLDKAFAEGNKRDLTYLKTESAFDTIKDDPRFTEMLRRVGLPL